MPIAKIGEKSKAPICANLNLLNQLRYGEQASDKNELIGESEEVTQDKNT